VAHILQIPIEFGFRIARVEWSAASARVTGWWKRDDGTIDTDGLTAEISHHGSTDVARFGLGDLPEQEWELCVETIGDEDDELVTDICSKWQPLLFLPSVADKEYRWTKSAFMRLDRADAWEMRDDFLHMASDHENAIAFLNKWGHWRGGRTDLERMLQLQRQVHEALTSPPAKWFTSSVPPYLDLWKRDPEYPFFALRTCHCETAICMTVTADLLRRAKFKICARKDCRAPFEVRSRHKKKYCRQYCGHLESVRKNRKSRKNRTSGGKNVDL
jgi:hypothetical protein